MRHADQESSKFRKMRHDVQKIENIDFKWKSTQDDLRQCKLTAIEQKALSIENRKLNILDDLRN
jgi:hypothetical protein